MVCIGVPKACLRFAQELAKNLSSVCPILAQGWPEIAQNVSVAVIIIRVAIALIGAANLEASLKQTSGKL